MIKALIFDFDGVLVSSEGPRSRVIRELLTHHDISMPDSIITAGRTTKRILEEVLSENPQLVDQILQEFREKYVQNIIDFVEPITFTVEFIRDYKGELPIAIASMSSRDAIERLTKHFGIFERIALIVSRDDVTNHKPHPEVYLKTAEKLQIDPKDCIVFEDTALGVQAAIAAGMQCSAILNGENKKEDLNGLPIHAFIENDSELRNTIA